MKIYLWISIISLSPVLLFSQLIISGKVVNAATQAPIPYVNIGIKSLGTGTISNADGIFELKANDANDMVTFSAIGYSSKDLPIQLLQQNALIELAERTYSMRPVEITAQRLEKTDRIFGVKNETRGHSVRFGSRQLGAAIGALISIDQPIHVKSAHFILNHASGDSILFRVNIYTYKDGMIGDNLLQENILIKTAQKRGEVSVDLTRFNIFLEQPVLLALE